MAVHSRYGGYYMKDILCSTDSWRGWGSEEFTLPHLLQDMGELVHINRGGVVFSYSSKNWPEPNLGSRQQGICGHLSSVRSGIIVLQSVVHGPMACRACWMSGHTQSLPCSVGQLGSPQWHRVVFYHWGGYVTSLVHTGIKCRRAILWPHKWER